MEDTVATTHTSGDLSMDDVVIDAIKRSGLGVALVDRDLRFLWVSEPFASLVGRGPRELVGRSILDITHEADAHMSRDLTRAVFAGSIPYFLVQKRYIRSDGSAFTGDLMVSVAAGEDEATVAVAVLTDAKFVDPLTLRVEQLQRTAALGEMCAGMVHDLKATTLVIRQAASELASSPDHSPAIANITSALENAEDLLASVSELAGPREPNAPVFPLEALLDDAQPMLRMVVPNYTRLEITNDVPRVKVRISAVEFRQVLLNLIMNARDAVSPIDGVIRISTFQTATGPGFVTVSVTDNGPGLDPDLTDSIFDPYVTSKGADGTGLGLTLSRDIARRCGGDLTVDATPGEGPIFAFRLAIESCGSIT